MYRIRRRYSCRLTLVLFLFILQGIGNDSFSWAEDEELTREEEWRQLREEKGKTLKPDPHNSIEKGALYVQKERLLEKLEQGWSGFHPRFGGLSTGSGFAAGVRYAPIIAGGKFDFQVSGAASLRVYQLYDLTLGAPKLFEGKFSLDFYGRYNSYPQEDFFGIGSDSRSADRTNYARENKLYDITAGINWKRWLVTGIRTGYEQTNVGRGTDNRFPSTDAFYSPEQLPELKYQPNYYHMDGFIRFDTLDEPRNPHAGGKYEIDLAYYKDQNLKLYSFRRLDIELLQNFPFLQKKRVITARALTRLTDTAAGQSIPFYMLPYLGGSESMRGFTEYTLRGYREFRFRDRNLILMNVEYRWEAFSGLDLAIFCDAGKVAYRRRDINFKDLESDVGFGFRFNTFKSVFLRIDVGFSHEGTRVFFKFGPAF